jgi:hypothetical protein
MCACCISYSNTLDSAEHFKAGNITNMGVLICLIVLIQDIYIQSKKAKWNLNKT